MCRGFTIPASWRRTLTRERLLIILPVLIAMEWVLGGFAVAEGKGAFSLTPACYYHPVSYMWKVCTCIPHWSRVTSTTPHPFLSHFPYPYPVPAEVDCSWISENAAFQASMYGFIVGLMAIIPALPVSFFPMSWYFTPTFKLKVSVYLAVNYIVSAGILFISLVMYACATPLSFVHPSRASDMLRPFFVGVGATICPIIGAGLQRVVYNSFQPEAARYQRLQNRVEDGQRPVQNVANDHQGPNEVDQNGTEDGQHQVQNVANDHQGPNEVYQNGIEEDQHPVQNVVNHPQEPNEVDQNVIEDQCPVQKVENHPQGPNEVGDQNRSPRNEPSP